MKRRKGSAGHVWRALGVVALAVVQGVLAVACIVWAFSMRKH